MPTRTFRLLALALLVTSPGTLHGADAPAVPACDRVRFEPSSGSERAMVGAKIEGSNTSRSGGYVTLATVEERPVAGTWNEVRFPNTRLYRWLRMAMPVGAAMKIGRVEFYSGEKLLGGEGRGAKFSPFVEGRDAVNDGAVGYDVFDTATTNRPSFSPAAGDLEGPLDLKLGGPRGATIRYTLDGSTPTLRHGETYAGPIRIARNTTVTAIAIAADREPSLAVPMTYLIQGQAAPGLVTAHIGNSLTGTANGFWRYARTAGHAHRQDAFLRPGALTRELWAVSTGEYRDDKIAYAKERQAQERGSLTWDAYWSKIGRVDHLTLQPRDFNLEKEVAAEVHFLRRFREKSPDLQPWLYCEWVELKRQRPSDQGVVPSYQMDKTLPALT